jgi:hypothetical protein
LKYINVLIIFTLLPTMLFSKNFSLGDNKISFSLNEKWKIKQQDSVEGIKLRLYEREPVQDSKNLLIHPTILIKLYQIEITNSSNKTKSDSVALDKFTKQVLRYDAPVLVIKEYEGSRKKKPIKYEIPYKPSYGFLITYNDFTYNVTHESYYITLIKKNKLGVLIVVDATQDVFKIISEEISDFLKSLTIY